MKKILLLAVLAFLVVGCATRAEIDYFRDIEEADISGLNDIYQPPKIKVNDILKIDITALNQQADAPSTAPYQFQQENMNSTGSSGGGRGGGQSNGNLLLQGYVVSKDGNINYPGLGNVYLKGLTTRSAEAKIEKLLSQYINNPTVRVRFLNFKVTVLGEVGSPGSYVVNEEAATIPQVLAMAGDLTIQGQRENVLLIRQINGRLVPKRIDLTETDWMDDPEYFIKQNDIIYVEPNGPKVKSAGYIGGLSSLFSTISLLISFAILAFK